LASSPTDFPVHRFAARDGVMLAWRELGEGRPLVLIHGLFSNAWTNWIRYGHAARIAAAGFRVIMPDLRAHGESGAPHAVDRYPPDILAEDGLALIDHLGLGDFDLGGYSLGARTVVRMLVAGAVPRRVALGGMGLEGMLDLGSRLGFFRGVLADPEGQVRSTPGFAAAAFLKTTGGDPQALLPLLGSFVPTTRAALATLALPALVYCGAEDRDNGSAEALAETLPRGRYVEIPGNHMSAVVRPELGAAITDFLTG